MADETARQGDTTQDAGTTEPQGAGEPTDWKAEYDKLLADSRKWERRAKDNAQKAKAYDELAAKSMTDAERADAATKRAEEAEAKIAEYERRAERAGIVSEVARQTGADAELLARMTGDTREEVEANAAWLAEKLADRRLYPSVSDKGQQHAPRMTDKDISAIKDPAERVKARARAIARNRH